MVITVANAIRLSLVKRPHVYFVLENVNTGKHIVMITFTSEIASSLDHKQQILDLFVYFVHYLALPFHH